VYALIKKLVEKKGIEEIYLGASHNLCMERARERLSELHADYHLKEVVVTNSIPQTDVFQALPFVSVRCLSDILTRVINWIHFNRSVVLSRKELRELREGVFRGEIISFDVPENAVNPLLREEEE